MTGPSTYRILCSIGGTSLSALLFVAVVAAVAVTDDDNRQCRQAVRTPQAVLTAALPLIIRSRYRKDIDERVVTGAEA